MASIGTVVATAATGLRVQQAALNVVAHNVANAATEGYSRQRAVLSTNPALHAAEGAYGTGARLVDVVSIRDALLDASFWTATGGAAQHQARSRVLARIEAVFGEPSEKALSGSLDRFLSAWSDLASNPGSPVARSVVRQRGQELADKLNNLAASVDQVRQDVEARLAQGMDRVNTLAADIARLNREIVSVEAGGIMSGDLRDARARAVDELASFLPVRVTERANGGIGVETAGFHFVDGAYHTPLELAGEADGTVGIRIPGRAGFVSEQGGSLGGLLQVLNTDVPALTRSLDELAHALVTEVNAIHGAGTNPAGDTGVDFFDAAFTKASSLRLSSPVAQSARAIASGTGAADGSHRAGANDVALALAALRDSTLGTLGATPGEHLRGLVSSLGLAVRSSTDAAEVNRILAEQADLRRQSVSGVSVDEELVLLIQHQSAYQAAARVVSAADEMLQSLLGI
jgi:flagellar hook-associated protein 1 FlgK